MTTTRRSAEIGAIALLDEPARRALYDAVIGAGRSVGRDEAAAAAGVSRALAAFHLDKLVEGGLLEVEFRRLSGRTGPGAGRPAKLYRRGALEVAVSLPQRTYQIPADLLATAVERMTGDLPPDALRAAARELGQRVGAAARRSAGPKRSRKRLRVALATALAERGYEPRESTSGKIRLGNCPFHALVEEHRDLVCGMNLALADGILGGLQDDGLEAVLDSQPGQCCVAFQPRSSDGRSS